jgi:uncharacterized membrane protein
MEQRAPRRARIDSVDIMRGLIMVVMALDHVRDFWSNAAVDPTDPATSTPALFATRWITHLCAPWFMLLAGAGAYLSLGRDRSPSTLVRFLVTRGLWLIALELTIVNVFWKGLLFDPTFVRFMVLCALGGSMIALAAMVRLPKLVILAIAVVMIVGHDAFDDVSPDRFGSFAWLWELLHVPGIIGAEPHKGWSMFVLYPLIPWIGVMALGYVGGSWLESMRDDPHRARKLAIAGVVVLAVFAVVRALDIYGDPQPWVRFDTFGEDAMSFLEVSKYPPSLDFVLATLGTGFVVLAAIDATVVARPWRVFRTFGRVPMFFYLVHIPLIATTSQLAYRIANGAWRSEESVWGFGLPGVYAIWIACIALLYLPCVWFAGVKARRRDWWLGYV